MTFSGPATFGDTTRYSSQTTTTVCGFCADINIANGGTVWYRQTQDATLMADLAQIARNYDIFGTAYTPTSALVATWEAVADFKPTPGMVRSCQVRSECLTCTFRASCCSARLSRAQVPAFTGSSDRDRKKKGRD